MDWLDNPPVIPCVECGKLFRPAQSGILRCRACQEAIETASSVEISETAIPPENSEDTSPEETAIAPLPLCRHCRTAPAIKGQKWCPACKDTLRRSISKAAADLSDKVRRIKEDKVIAIHLLAAIEEKRIRTTGIITENKDTPQIKTF